MAIDHQQLIKDSVRELSELVRERRRLDDQIKRLQRLVRTTATRVTSSNNHGIAELKEKDSMGLTEAVRHVFGDKAVQRASDLPIPRRERLLREWKNATGWR